jgi:hypothetical protein
MQATLLDAERRSGSVPATRAWARRQGTAPRRRLLPALLAAALGAAGCGGASAQGGPTGILPFEPVAHYAALFEPERTWRYVVTPARPVPIGDADAGAASDADDDAAPVPREVTCRVVEASGWLAAGGGRISRIECDGALADGLGEEPLAGLWAADRRGLFRVDAWPAPDTWPVLPDGAEVIASLPVDGVRELPGDAGGPPAGAVAIRADGEGRWCRDDTTLSDRETWQTSCFGPGGVTGGAAGERVDTDDDGVPDLEREATFTLLGP